jgi:hypothetical protein
MKVIGFFGRHPRYLFAFNKKMCLLEKRINNKDEWMTIFKLGKL